MFYIFLPLNKNTIVIIKKKLVYLTPTYNKYVLKGKYLNSNINKLALNNIFDTCSINVN